MKRTRVTLACRPARYTRRLVIFEDPAAVERLQELADAAGHSIAAEVRYAVPRWLKECAEED
jgi:hypothetical protein